MKIGIYFDPHKNGYARFGKMKFSKIAQHGFLAIDYNMADTETEIFSLNDGDFERKIHEIKTEADSANLEISQVHGPWRYPPQDSTVEDRQERMDKMKKSILATKMLGCKYWVVHPIMPYGTKDLEIGAASKTWELNLAFMSELLEFAKKQDVTICLENMPFRNFSLATPTQILKFVKTMNDEHFKICLDTGHVAVFSGSSVGDSVYELGEELKVLHIHDNMGDRDSHLCPTKGIIDWSKFISALKDVGFNGVFSLETSPSVELDDDLFETECIKLCGITKAQLEKT